MTPRRTTPAPVRFWAKVVEDGECWIWTGAILKEGYGYFGDLGKCHLAHRWAYKHMVGGIPDGLVIDHLCRNRACVNPFHMEPVPQRINVLRGDMATGRQPTTHCFRGHEFTPDNVDRLSNGGRTCSTCRRDRDREAKRKLRLKRKAVA